MSKLILFPEIDKITLSAGHSLITSSVPEFIGKVERNSQFFDRVHREHVESFGLFETATPNFQTYYPDVVVSDLANEADYIEPIFRALSEVIVRKAFDPIDFSKNGVLKASMKKLVGQTVYPNHEAVIGNQIGAVKEVFWEEAYTTNDGYKIPAGINAKFRINGKAHPNIASGILSNPPEIHSNSVTVFFAWEPSHKKMSQEEFRGRVGTYDDKGQLIRRIVTEVRRYNETSLVPHGADPFAQLIKDPSKGIVNPAYASDRDSLSEDGGKIRRYFGFSYKEDNLAELSESFTIPEQLNDNESQNDNNPKNKKMKKGLAILLASLAGVPFKEEFSKLSDSEFEEQFDVEGFTEEVLNKKTELEGLSELAENLTTAQNEIESLKKEKVELEKFKAENSEKLQLINSVHAEMLAEVKRLYGIVAKDKQSAKLIETFEAADYKTLQAFKLTYESQVEESFEQECPKCGENVTLGAEHQAEGSASNKPKDEKLTSYQLTQKILEKKLKIDTRNIHG